MRLGVYGGSFDPPHLAHVGATRHLLESGQVEGVLVVPVYEHAFAKGLSPFAERLAMCRLAFADQPAVEVSELERELPRPNYTVQLIEELRARRPADELRLIVGADVLGDLSRWHQAPRLLELAPLLVLGRAGYPRDDAPAPVLPEVSSSELRAHAALHGTLRGVDGIPPAVLDYIEQRGLYR